MTLLNTTNLANTTPTSSPSPIAKTVSTRPLGAHMPCTDGVKSTLTSGVEIGCTAVQLFTNTPKQWSYHSFKPEVIEPFLEAQKTLQIPFLVSHDSYLINLASPNEEGMTKSRKAFRAELDRAEQLGLSWVVTHMGAHLGTGTDAAIDRLIESISLILADTDALGYKVGVALETTAGQGTGLGATFEELGRVLDGVGANPRLGVCLDTCHIFVAGYDFRTPETYQETWDKFEELIGRDRLKLIHANDAKMPFASRKDRHEHIGEGEIGEEGFRLLLNDPLLAHVPVIVETPDSEEMHRVNVARLRALSIT
ncbi:MAG: deoxyribonuclease IV [Chthonomonadaceae bacterium]|nr:deoxyribonuclease IV [Chthonomonadaceae bacterium]